MTNTPRPWAAEVSDHRKLTTLEIKAVEALLQRAWDGGVWSPEMADLDRLALAAIYGDESAWLTHHARRAVVARLRA